MSYSFLVVSQERKCVKSSAQYAHAADKGSKRGKRDPPKNVLCEPKMCSGPINVLFKCALEFEGKPCATQLISFIIQRLGAHWFH